MLPVVPLGVGEKYKPGGSAVIDPVKIEIRIAEPLMLPDVAMTWAEPSWTAVARPVGVTEAAAPSLVHVTELVRFCVLPSV